MKVVLIGLCCWLIMAVEGKAQTATIGPITLDSAVHYTGHIAPCTPAESLTTHRITSTDDWCYCVFYKDEIGYDFATTYRATIYRDDYNHRAH